ncbi:hypothetical protein Pelo_14107 [Pelomyxa schiedti]|nr:hypothetical protein Pelo_14107 [Pelomyxa schiedti]
MIVLAVLVVVTLVLLLLVRVYINIPRRSSIVPSPSYGTRDDSASRHRHHHRDRGGGHSHRYRRHDDQSQSQSQSQSQPQPPPWSIPEEEPFDVSIEAMAQRSARYLDDVPDAVPIIASTPAQGTVMSSQQTTSNYTGGHANHHDNDNDNANANANANAKANANANVHVNFGASGEAISYSGASRGGTDANMTPVPPPIYSSPAVPSSVKELPTVQGVMRGDSCAAAVAPLQSSPQSRASYYQRTGLTSNAGDNPTFVRRSPPVTRKEKLQISPPQRPAQASPLHNIQPARKYLKDTTFSHEKFLNSCETPSFFIEHPVGGSQPRLQDIPSQIVRPILQQPGTILQHPKLQSNATASTVDNRTPTTGLLTNLQSAQLEETVFSHPYKVPPQQEPPKQERQPAPQERHPLPQEPQPPPKELHPPPQEWLPPPKELHPPPQESEPPPAAQEQPQWLMKLTETQNRSEKVLPEVQKPPQTEKPQFQAPPSSFLPQQLDKQPPPPKTEALFTQPQLFPQPQLPFQPPPLQPQPPPQLQTQAQPPPIPKPEPQPQPKPQQPTLFPFTTNQPETQTKINTITRDAPTQSQPPREIPAISTANTGLQLFASTRTPPSNTATNLAEQGHLPLFPAATPAPILSATGVSTTFIHAPQEDLMAKLSPQGAALCASMNLAINQISNDPIQVQRKVLCYGNQ